MTQNHFIKQFLNIKDPHIQLEDRIEFIKSNHHTAILLFAKLTYRPECCTHCGVKNCSHADIIKNGTYHSTILLGNYNGQAVRMKLTKQRYFCKHCQRTFGCQTDLVDPHCFISRKIKQLIYVELKETQAMTLIAKHFHVSPHTVMRILETTTMPSLMHLPTLPTHLAIDEFRSVKHVIGAMSCVLVNNHRGTLFDILEDRRQASLYDYFMRYSLKERKKVQTITIDMYRPYYDFFQQLFPNAEIIIDRFHIVQHINRAIRKVRMTVMNAIKSKRSRDYRKLKNLWKLLEKHEHELDIEHYHTHRLFEGFVTEKQIVNYLLSIDERLATVYRWGNRLKYALQVHNGDQFFNIIEESRKYQLPAPLRTAIQTFKRMEAGIRNACIYTLSNGYIEGLNNKIKLIKRSGFGYRRFDHLKARILLSQQLRDPDQWKRSVRPLTFEAERQQKAFA